jgi:hypothetical protein
VPLRDLDLYWHLLVGEALLAGTPLAQVGADWSFAPPGEWRSTQWLAEVALHGLHAGGGWEALAAIRVISLAVILAILALTTLRGRPTSRAAWPFLLATWAVWLASEERPQQVTFVGAAILGGVLLRGLVEGRLPRWWVLLPLTLLWANLHGGWALVPVVLLLVAIGRVLDHGLRDRTAQLAAGLSVAALAMGAVSPTGVSNVTAIGRFGDAASAAISEWQRTEPLSIQGFATVGLMLLVGISWARSGRQIPRSEVLALLLLLLFAWTAWRNVAPASLLMAPLVAHRLSQAFPASQARERAWSTRLGIALAATGLLAGLATVWSRDNLPREEYPVALAASIASLPGEQRVLNDYAVGGLILFFSDQSAQVGIDGRTDRYGAEYIDDYLELMDLTGSWEDTLAELAPTAALLRREQPLAHVLVAERGWREVGQEADHVLLVPPSSEGRSP